MFFMGLNVFAKFSSDVFVAINLDSSDQFSGTHVS
jgi:hypothetical protein